MDSSITATEASKALEKIDALLVDAGMQHGRRQLLRAGYTTQARHPRQEAPEPQQRSARVDEVTALTAPGLAFLGVRHGFAARTGGITTAYGQAGDLNLGFSASDARENVLANRARLLGHVFGSPLPLLTLKQTHSAILHRVGRAQGSEDAQLTGDGLLTDEPGIALGIQTADCVPVLVADRRTGAVAAFHAGWRGTLKRIVEHGIGRMRLEFGSKPEDLCAAIGPAIGPCCYGVGEEVEHEFRSQFRYADALFHEVYDSDPIRKKYPMLFLTQRAPGHSDLGPALHLDLQEANRRQLIDAGLPENSVEAVGKCTSCRTDLFFSYRAKGGFTGRMLAVIARA